MQPEDLKDNIEHPLKPLILRFIKEEGRFPNRHDFEKYNYLPAPWKVTRHYGGFSLLKDTFLKDISKGHSQKDPMSFRMSHRDAVDLLKTSIRQYAQRHTMEIVEDRYGADFVLQESNGDAFIIKITTASTIRSFKDTVTKITSVLPHVIERLVGRPLKILFVSTNPDITQDRLNDLLKKKGNAQRRHIMAFANIDTFHRLMLK